MKVVRVIKDSKEDAQLQSIALREKYLFHTHAWLSCYDVRLQQYAILNRNNELIGAFLLYIYRTGGFSFVIAPPFTPGIALWFTNPGTSTVGRNSFSKEVMALIAGFLKSFSSHHIDIQLSPEAIDIQPFIWSGFRSSLRYTYLVSLNVSEEQLLSDLSPEKRQSLRKAVKEQTYAAPSADAELLITLISERLGRKGVGKNLEILQRIIRTFAGTPECISFVASSAGKPVAAAFSVISEQKAIYVLGGIASGGNHGAGVSCMWESMLEAKRRGIPVFDFEGSMDENIERYFREFGGVMTPYPAIQRTKPLVNLLRKLRR